MSLFCLAAPLVFFLFWKSLSDENEVSTGGIWAVILGSIAAAVHYFTSPLITSGEFGFLQWVIGFVDVIVFPVITALAVCLLFRFLKFFSATINPANFLLLWSIPFSVFQTLTAGPGSGPLYLVVVPLLWIGLAVGFRFFIKMIPEVKRSAMILCIVGAVLLPLAAATAYWALYRQNDILGYILFGISLVPMTIHTGMLFVKSFKR